MSRPLRVGTIAAGVAVLATLVVYAFLRYGDAVGLFFFLDDFWVLLTADAAHRGPGSALAAIFRPSHNGLMLYRPFTTGGYFYVLRQLFGLDAAPYHAFQILVFATNAWLVAAITRVLTASWGWGLVGGIVYAAAPGHAMAVYWVGAATMTFTATVVLLSLLWSLLAPPRWRGPGAVALQLFALGCSEHAVVVPALLACLVWLGPARATLRETVRLVAPPVAVTALYLGLKLAYLFYAGFPHSAYTPVADVAAWVTNLGRFAVATASLPALAVGTPSAALLVGAVVLVALPMLAALARRRGGGWALPAAGAWVFVSALLPVLPLANHFYTYFIGVAALGTALVVVGACRALPRGGALAAVALLGASLVTDRLTCDRAAQADSNVALLHTVQAGSLDLLRSLDYTARRAPGRFVHVPDTPLNMSVVGFGGANRVFFDPPVRVHYGSAPVPSLGPTPSPLLPAPPDVPMPGADPAWDWLRRLAPAVHAHYAGECG